METEIKTETDTPSFADGNFSVIKQLEFGVDTIIVIVVESLLGVLIVLVNALCLWLIFRDRRLLESSTNVYIVSMCFADIGAGILVPVIVGVVHAGYPRELRACVFVNCVVNVMVSASVLCLICVVADRYTYLVRAIPVHRGRDTRWSWIISGFVWLLALGLGLTPFLGWHKVPPGDFRYCSYTDVIPVEYNVYVRFLGVNMPIFLIMLLLNGHVFGVFLYSNRKIAMMNVWPADGVFTKPSELKARLRHYLLFDKREMRLLRALAFAFFLHSVTKLPLNIANTVRMLHPDTRLPRPLVQLLVILSHSHSLVDPIMYVLNQNSMRRALKRWCFYNLPKNHCLFLRDKILRSMLDDTTSMTSKSKNETTLTNASKISKYVRTAESSRESSHHSGRGDTSESMIRTGQRPILSRKPKLKKKAQWSVRETTGGPRSLESSSETLSSVEGLSEMSLLKTQASSPGTEAFSEASLLHPQDHSPAPPPKQ